MKNRDLEERLIDFSVLIIKLVQVMPKTREGNYLADQIVRSGPSSALNYGEAQAAESRKDFIHKMRISLKELRETLVNLKIIRKAELMNDTENLIKTLIENNELVAIFISSIKTAQSKEY